MFLKKGDFFDSRALDETTKYLIKYFENNGFSFVKVVPSINKRQNLLDITYDITEGNKKFINKIIM